MQAGFIHTCKKGKTLRSSETKIPVICFTNGLISEQDTPTEITPVTSLSLLHWVSPICCLPPPRLTSQSSASESCLSDKLLSRTCREARTFASRQSSWWAAEGSGGQFAGSCEVCGEWKSSLSARRGGDSHHTQTQSADDAGVCVCVCVSACIHMSRPVCIWEFNPVSTEQEAAQTALTYSVAIRRLVEIWPCLSFFYTGVMLFIFNVPQLTVSLNVKSTTSEL